MIFIERRFGFEVIKIELFSLVGWELGLGVCVLVDVDIFVR